MTIIEKFKSQVSWLDTYVHLNANKKEWKRDCFMSRWNCYLAKVDMCLLRFLCIPSEDFQEAVSLLSTFDDKIWLIVDGELQAASILEKFLFETHRNIIPFFLSPETNIQYNELIERALDGIDWEKSLMLNKLIFEWGDQSSIN